jgi:hypothetical protein
VVKVVQVMCCVLEVLVGKVVLLPAVEADDVLPSNLVPSSHVPFTPFAVNAVCHQRVHRQRVYRQGEF